MNQEQTVEEMSNLYNKATSYLSDHILEFHELYDLFCSNVVEELVSEDNGINGGMIYDSVISAFETKYKQIFAILKKEDDCENELCVDDMKGLNYQALFIRLLDDKIITPRELYLLENATKEISSEEKFKIIDNVLRFINALTSLYKNKKTIPNFDDQIKKVREEYGFNMAQSLKIESYIRLAEIKN